MWVSEDKGPVPPTQIPVSFSLSLFWEAKP